MGKAISANMGIISAETGNIFKAFAITLQIKQISSILYFTKPYNFIIYENKNCINRNGVVTINLDIGTAATYQGRSTPDDEQRGSPRGTEPGPV